MSLKEQTESQRIDGIKEWKVRLETWNTSAMFLKVVERLLSIIYKRGEKYAIKES